jgi:hypothetical protein
MYRRSEIGILGIGLALFASVEPARTYDFPGVVTGYNQYLSAANAIGTPLGGTGTDVAERSHDEENGKCQGRAAPEATGP